MMPGLFPASDNKSVLGRLLAKTFLKGFRQQRTRTSPSGRQHLAYRLQPYCKRWATYAYIPNPELCRVLFQMGKAVF